LLYINEKQAAANHLHENFERFRDLGFAENFNDLLELNLIENLGIELVELIPWSEEGSDSHPFGDYLEDDPLAAGFPSKGSLTGNTDVYTSGTIRGEGGAKINYTRVQHETPGGNFVFTTKFHHPNGGTAVVHHVVGSDNELLFRSQELYDKDGNLIEHRDSGQNPEAEAPEPEQPEDEEVADGDNPNEDGEDGEEGEGVTGYQPTDGGVVMCPLYLEYCRRVANDILEGANPDRIKLGFLRINPAQEDDYTDSPRLNYDPNDFVVNPNPNAGTNRGGEVVPHTQFNIPVLINPPGPDEE
jgi:hypothetical protein